MQADTQIHREIIVILIPTYDKTGHNSALYKDLEAGQG